MSDIGVDEVVDTVTVTDYKRAVFVANVNVVSAKGELQRAVQDARNAGISWSDIANEIGLTAAAVTSRYGPKSQYKDKASGKLAKR